MRFYSVSTSAALITCPEGIFEKSSFTPDPKNKSSGASSIEGAGLAPSFVVE
jgi:hypothetical protein